MVSLPARVLGLMLFAGAFLLVAPPSQAFAEGPEISTAQPADVAGFAPTREAALIGGPQPPGGLPFARTDLALLLLGGAIITAAAAAVPFLLGLLRLAAPLAIRAAGAAEPLVAAAEQVAPVHVPA